MRITAEQASREESAVAAILDVSGPACHQEGATVDPALYRFARQLHDERDWRSEWLDPALLGEPAWDMLLDLFAAEGEGFSVNVTNAAVAGRVPLTTALRYLTAMTGAGIVERHRDASDHRASIIRLTATARSRMAHLLHRIYLGRKDRGPSAAGTCRDGPPPG